jgi:hypothetical protein
MEDDRPSTPELEPREPTLEDLRDLCRELNQRGARYVVVRDVDGVAIPFASPGLLWRMKAVTHREKDAGDLLFLRYWFSERGQEPPKTP